MAQRRGRSFGGQRRASPNRSWSSTFPITSTAVAAGSKILLTSFVLNNPGIDETILRTRGSLMVRSDQIGASEDQFGTLGLIVVTDIALAAGIASIPSPSTNGSNDGWFVWVPFAQRFTFSSAVGVQSQGGMVYDIDSKAKRIVQDGHAVALVIENSSSTFGISVALNLRILSMTRGSH